MLVVTGIVRLAAVPVRERGNGVVRRPAVDSLRRLWKCKREQFEDTTQQGVYTRLCKLVFSEDRSCNFECFTNVKLGGNRDLEKPFGPR